MAVITREEWKTLSFLVVDDARVVRAMLEMTLLSLGASSVHLATEGAEAIEKLKHDPADVIILDLNMYPVSGLEFLKMLRALDDVALAQTPVIVMSGYDEREVKDDIWAAGADAFLSKPAKPGVIEQTVRAVLEAHAQRLTVRETAADRVA